MKKGMVKFTLALVCVVQISCSLDTAEDAQTNISSLKSTQSISQKNQVDIGQDIKDLFTNSANISNTRSLAVDSSDIDNQRILLNAYEITDDALLLYFAQIVLEENETWEDITGLMYTKAAHILDKHELYDHQIKIFIAGQPLSRLMEASNPISPQVRTQAMSRNTLISNQSRSDNQAKKKILISGGHGYTEISTGNWGWQRPLMNAQGYISASGDYREDITDAELGLELTQLLQQISSLDTYYLRQQKLTENDDPIIGVSGLPAWQENARQYFKTHNLPYAIWNTASSGKSVDKDINSRSLYANYLGVDVMISIHTDAGAEGSALRGTRMWVSDGCYDFAHIDESKKLADVLTSHFSSKLKEYDSAWQVHSPRQKCHSESSLGNMPSVIIELGYHTNAQDLKALKDQEFRTLAMQTVVESVKEYLAVEDSPSPPLSTIDGAGSLIMPNKSCWGCDKDEVRMHPSDNPSTAVFQWKAVDSCDYIDVGIAKKDTGDISADSLEVTLHNKKWNTNTPSQAYSATLPVSIAKVDTWNTTAITSKHPVAQTKRIIAKCRISPTFNTSFSTAEQSKLSVIGNYNWTGNASLIARDNTPDYGTQNAGIRQDWVRAPADLNSVTLFQWQPSEACSTIKLVPHFSALDTTANIEDVSMKLWHHKEWQSINHMCSSLPCEIPAKSLTSYYLIKLKAQAGQIDNNYIRANCAVK